MENNERKILKNYLLNDVVNIIDEYLYKLPYLKELIKYERAKYKYDYKAIISKRKLNSYYDTNCQEGKSEVYTTIGYDKKIKRITSLFTIMLTYDTIYTCEKIYCWYPITRLISITNKPYDLCYYLYDIGCEYKWYTVNLRKITIVSLPKPVTYYRRANMPDENDILRTEPKGWSYGRLYDNVKRKINIEESEKISKLIE